MHRGWTKSWRKELDSDIWQMPPMYHRVWHYLLGKVNWTMKRMPTTKIMGMYISPGMIVTSYQQIAEGVSYREGRKRHTPNKRTVMKILEWLEGNGMIGRESNGSGTVILINNWHTYQDNSDDGVTAENGQGVTNNAPHSAPPDAPPGKRCVHTTKKLKEVKEVKEEDSIRKKGSNSPHSNFPINFRTFTTMKEANDSPLEEETAASIEYFLTRYEEVKGERHPNLKPDQWQHHVDTFMSCIGEPRGHHDITLEDHEVMIDKYFETDFGPDCDYRIHHYNTEGVKACRFYEECY